MLPILALLWCFLAVKMIDTKLLRESDVYSSVHDLSKIFLLEQRLVEKLERLTTLSILSADNCEHINKVVMFYKTKGCWPSIACNEEKVAEEISANPLNCFKILQRLGSVWKNVAKEFHLENYISIHEEGEGIKEMLHNISKSINDGDLEGVVRGIFRSQKMYRLEVRDLVKGIIMGHPTFTTLDGDEIFAIGKLAIKYQEPRLAIEWMNAVTILKSNNEKNYETTRTKALQYINWIKSVFKEALEEPNLGYLPLMSSTKVQTSLQMTYLENLDNITLKDKNDNVALCREANLMSEHEQKKLFCFNSAIDPYFILHPIKVEVAHRHPHQILVFHDVVSRTKTDEIIKHAASKIKRNYVGITKDMTEMQTSKYAYVTDESTKLSEKLTKRISWITGLQTGRSFDKFKDENTKEYEPLFVTNYGVGGHYSLHLDRGSRLATFMIYLSDVLRGGYTVFPKLGVIVTPRRGSAIFWYNIKKDGNLDGNMLHSACPVALGNKWIANKFIKENPNMLNTKYTKI